jgi:hypothetical protein
MRGFLAGKDQIKARVEVAGTSYEVEDAARSTVNGIDYVAEDVGVDVANGIARLAGLPAVKAQAVLECPVDKRRGATA